MVQRQGARRLPTQGDITSTRDTWAACGEQLGMTGFAAVRWKQACMQQLVIIWHKSFCQPAACAITIGTLLFLTTECIYGDEDELLRWLLVSAACLYQMHHQNRMLLC
jgi:hypothetical protein